MRDRIPLRRAPVNWLYWPRIVMFWRLHRRVKAMVKGSLLLSGLALAIGGKAEADTISLKPMADSYIQQFSPDVNAGGDFSNVAGALGSTKNGEVRRIFMRFDLSNLVPQNAVINSVTLQVTVVNVPQFAVDSYFDLKRLLKPWTESGVTWNTATPGNPWEQAGATGSSDSVPSPSSSVLVSVLGQYTFSSSDQLRQDVQGWVANPSSNNGWLMMSEDEGTEETARRFGAREDPPDAAVLTVDYSIPQLSITAQPQSQTNFVGGSVTFQVAAAGTTPFSYQWFFNNNPLPDETNSTLTLDNLQTNQTGPYFVTVTNSSGSTNSQIAFLSVEPLPRGVPIVTIISPTNGARFPAHADITLAASAAESNGVITQVEFFVGTNSAGVVSSPPYMLTTNNVPAGNYSVRAVATDDSGNRGASPTISFSVFDPPGVTVTTPPAGSRFPLGTNITVTATVASKGARIIGVDFFATRTNRATGAIDTTNIGSASAAPYTISWLPADTGDYSLTATVTDELGQTGQTPSIFVRIFIPELILPVITITDGPANLSRVTSSPITFSGTANDNIGMDYVELVSSSGPFLIVPGSVVRAEGTTNWSASIAPAPGKNLIRFHGVDLANNRSADLTRISSRHLQRTFSGCGYKPVPARECRIFPAATGKRRIVQRQSDDARRKLWLSWQV